MSFKIIYPLLLFFAVQVQGQYLSDLIEELVYMEMDSSSLATEQDPIYDFELYDTDSVDFYGGPVDSLPPSSPLIRFYENRDFEAVWYEEGALLSRAGYLLEALEAAGQNGLSAEYYGYKDLLERYDGLNDINLYLYLTEPSDLASFDIALTKAAMQYTSDIHYGRIDPNSVELQWEIPQDPIIKEQKLQEALEAETIEQGIEDLHSKNIYYQRLLKALRDFDEQAKTNTDVEPSIAVPDSTAQDSVRMVTLEKKQKLEIGDTSIQVALLRQHLGSYFPELLDSSANIISVEYDTSHLKSEMIVVDTVSERIYDYEVCRDTIYVTKDSMYLLIDSTELSYDTTYINVDTFLIVQDSLNILSSDSVYNPTVFDSTLYDIVKKFQKQNGLEPDGIVGPQTLGSLTNDRSAEQRKILEINLDRWRRLPKDLSGRYIIVNIAGYYMDVFVDDSSDLHKEVMVGNPRTSTPVFSDVMHYIDLNPTWTVPYSIATREMLPKVKRDPSYLTRNNYELLSGGKAINPYSVDWESVGRSGFPYVFRQKPGSNNALGIVKFMFPNRYNIYLHDTPSKHLFSEAYRAYSHGCIRLEKPMELAYYLFKDDPKWNKEKLDATLNKRKNKRINLEVPVPIYLLYFTAWVNDAEELYFLPDVYKRDDALLSKWK